ncbi:MAG: hypothetical protein MI865_10175, partial [Proteobacteria bacterium]|nr:hypothetical protein [Pseudomonadota bacterium]
KQACGTCQSCQLYMAGNHPDKLMIEPEDSGKQIKIAQIRELIEYVSLKSFSGNTKVAILDPAEAMNRATANALLKTLEEPPPQSMLLLLSHRPSSLPITIRSRCQRIEFNTTLGPEVTEWVNSQIGDTGHSAELLLQLSYGAPLKSLELLEDEQLEQRRIIIKDLKQLSKSGADVVKVAAKWQELGCTSVLGWLLRIIQDLVRLKLVKDKANIVNIDMKQDLQDLVKPLDLRALVQNYDLVHNKYQESVGLMNYNELSLLEEVVIHWNNPETAK